jgi:c(7)-type cytochrome triheme protein
MSCHATPSRTRSLLLTVFLLALLAVVADAAGSRRLPAHEYGTVLMDNFSKQNQLDPVVFRHWVHRAKHTCRLCHVDIGFAMTAGQTRVREKDNRAGAYCGVCHNGKEAFACEEKNLVGQKIENCTRCHSAVAVGHDDKSRDSFDLLAESLPEGRFGNRIDWAEAGRNEQVVPKDFIAGVSFPRARMKHEQGNIRLDAKLTGLPDIVFSHKEHALWNSCDLCHPEVFALKAGQSVFTMQDIFAGQFCGACHGKVAFPLKDCGRCHSKPVY